MIISVKSSEIGCPLGSIGITLLAFRVGEKSEYVEYSFSKSHHSLLQN